MRTRDRLKKFVKEFPDAELKSEDSLLHDMACPGCGHREGFHISFAGSAFVDDDSSEDEGDHEWDADSSCYCGQCGHVATVKAFTIKGLDDWLEAHKPEPATKAEVTP